MDQFNKIIKAKSEEVAELVKKVVTQEISNKKTATATVQDEYNTLQMNLDRTTEEFSVFKKETQLALSRHRG